MKNKLMKSIFALVLTFMALPMMGQDFMNIYFKNGDFRKFYMKNVTEIITSKFDADGVKHSDYDYQHITTLNNHYVYSLNDVDSITFTKFYEELAKQNFAKAMKELIPSLSDCESIEEANKQINNIKNARGVEEAWCDESELYVKVKNGITMSFHFSHDGEEDTYEENSAKKYIKELNKKIPQQIGSNNRNWTAVIANQTHYDEDGAKKSAKKDLFSLKDYLWQCNIDTFYVANPSIDFFISDIFDYDIIVLLTHGGYKNGQHAFITGNELGKVKKHFWQMDPSDEEQNKWSDEFYKILKTEKLDRSDITDQDIYFTWVEEERDGDQYWVGYPKIFESVYDKIEEGKFKNDKSIMFWASCHSLEGGNSFADKFFERNLGTFLGYDGVVSFYTAPPAALDFFKTLLYGKSIYSAYSDLPYRFIHDLYTLGASELLMVTNSNQTESYYNSTFITNTVTDIISPESVSEQFATSKTVEIKGFTTTLDTDAISMGFIYGKDEKLNYFTDVKDVEVIKLSKPLDNGNGNVVFRGKLTNLEPNNTYYYRAYTYDGMNYNYGETYSFEIKPSGDVNLTNGLVAYYPFNGNANDASGHGNHGTPSAKVVLSEGVNGDSNGAYQFGGYNNPGYIHVPNSESLKFSDGATFSAYFKVSSWTGMDANGNKTNTKGTFCIMAKSHDTRGWTILCNGNDQKLHVEGFNFGGWGSINTDMLGNYLNKWTHVAVVFGIGYERLYVDGQLVKEKETTLNFGPMNGEDLYIGKYSDKWYPFNGMIDEFRIYNRPLTSEEVRQLAQYAE